jgi:rubrerythrin
MMMTCERCGRATRLPDYPCDSVDCTVERLIRFWPAGYPNRTAALEHLLATVGNGYEWVDGALTDVFWDAAIYRRRREDVEKAIEPTDVLPPDVWMDDAERSEAQAAYDAERERLRSIRDRAAELAVTPGPLRRDPWESMMLASKPEQRSYLAAHLRIIPLPKDVRADWKAAGDELAAVLAPVREMLQARLDETARQAADAVEELRAAAHLLSDTGNPVAAVSLPLSVELGHLLRHLAKLGHDVHEAPTGPAGSGVWECTACGHLGVMPENCPGWSAVRAARHVNTLGSPDRLAVLRAAVRAGFGSGPWTTGRAVDVLGGQVTPERARQLLNTLTGEGLLVKHGVRGRLWTYPDHP